MRSNSAVCTETNFLQIADVCDGASQLRLCGGTAVSCRLAFYDERAEHANQRTLSLTTPIQTTPCTVLYRSQPTRKCLTGYNGHLRLFNRGGDIGHMTRVIRELGFLVEDDSPHDRIYESG